MNIRQLTYAALGFWFAAVSAAGASGAFVTQPGTPPLPILIGATLPLAVFFAAYALSSRFRELVRGADLRLLIGLQAWRAGGLGFIALSVHGVLPGLFAWPAGLGDIAIGLTAPWIALALARDPAFVGTPRFTLWNWLGILDLVVAVSLGAASSGVLSRSTGGLTTIAMTQLPLVLIPAYFVPLFLILHFTALVQARRPQGQKPSLRPRGLSFQ